MVLDARFISGSDGDAIGTWASRTSSTYDMTQSTASYKPLLKLGANGINGQAAVKFDGTNDYLSGVNESISTFSIFSVAYSTNAGTYRSLFSRAATASFDREVWLACYTPNDVIILNRSNPTSFPFPSSSDFTLGNHVVYGYYDGTNLGIRVDRKTMSTVAGTSSNATQPWEVGSLMNGTNGRQWWWDSNIGSVIFFKNSVVTSSVEKRLSHSQAFSFKLQCS